MNVTVKTPNLVIEQLYEGCQGRAMYGRPTFSVWITTTQVFKQANAFQHQLK